MSVLFYLVIPIILSIISLKNFFETKYLFMIKNILQLILCFGKILLLLLSYFLIKNEIYLIS